MSDVDGCSPLSGGDGGLLDHNDFVPIVRPPPEPRLFAEVGDGPEYGAGAWPPFVESEAQFDDRLRLEGLMVRNHVPGAATCADGLGSEFVEGEVLGAPTHNSYLSSAYGEEEEDYGHSSDGESSTSSFVPPSLAGGGDSQDPQFLMRALSPLSPIRETEHPYQDGLPLGALDRMQPTEMRGRGPVEVPNGDASAGPNGEQRTLTSWERYQQIRQKFLES